ncbi:FAS1 domain-containing protein [Aureobasidium sp. EXF-12298]|nr:FAS1 domain-containing protein [Aureobasidium sp. EXF-12298]KAI4765433.1 FAS1 domain-containing protein [Aureobasidium sp. EXF-12344]KAI4783284.1 FAS1 domain-containing protein [Aureobasidium sp. EXF-3400]
MRFQNIAPFALVAALASAQDNSTGGNLTTGGNISTSTNSTVPYANQQLNSFWSLLQQFNLLSSFSNERNITLLAPSNEALAKLNTSGVSITSELVQALINYHTINGTILSSNLNNVTSAFPHTHLTNPAFSNVTGGQVVEGILKNGTAYFFSGLKNNVSVVSGGSNLNFTGGVIHIVDGTLTIPGNLTSTLTNSNLTALAGAAQELNLTSTLSSLHDVTVFAPDNSAFQAVGDALANASVTELISVLGYHVVNNSVLYSADIPNGTTTIPTFIGANLTVQNINGSYYVNSAKVINPDILFSGGVIHVIDRVLNPNNTVAHNASQTASSSSTSQAFAGVTTRASNVPFTSGQATPSSSNPAQRSATTGALSSSTGAANAFATIGAAALFGGIGAAFAGF